MEFTILKNVLAQAAGGQGADGLMSFLPMILIVVVMYFFMIRPQMQRQKKEKLYRDSLQVNDQVVTLGGIYGRITGINDLDSTVQLEVDSNVTLKVDKSSLRAPGAQENQKPGATA